MPELGRSRKKMVDRACVVAPAQIAGPVKALDVWHLLLQNGKPDTEKVRGVNRQIRDLAE